MGTTLTYNGILLQNVLTRRFDETCEYDPSGTDLICHRFRIAVIGYVHSISAGTARTTVSTNQPGRSIVASHTLLRTALMHPRREFQFQVGGGTLLSVKPADGSSTGGTLNEVDNGPKPQRCSILKIAGSGIFQVEFEIEMAVVECSDSRNRLGILNNRWSMSDSIDENWYTTRTMTGRLRIADIRLNAQSFRKMCIPPLQKGFQRHSITTTTSPDGLTLDYTVVDRERYASPPFPGTEWEAVHSVTSNDGYSTLEEISIRVTGPKDASKKTLLAACSQVVHSKLYTDGRKPILQNAAIIDYMHENSVEIRVQVQQSPKGMVLDYGLSESELGKLIDPTKVQDYDRETWPIPKEYGTATPTGLFVSYLQTPCNDNHAVPNTTEQPTKRGNVPYGSGTPQVYTSEGELPKDPAAESNYSDAHKENIYTFYQVDSTYETDEGRLQLPIARRSESTSPGTGGSGGSGGGSDSSEDTAAFVKLHRGVSKRTIHVAAERSGDWPQIPDAPDEIDFGDGVKGKLLTWEMTPKAPKLSEDGKTKIYSVDAEYIYGLNRPAKKLQAFPTGALPWMSAKPADTKMPQSAMGSGITN